jgi:hypothetical protein
MHDSLMWLLYRTWHLQVQVLRYGYLEIHLARSTATSSRVTIQASSLRNHESNLSYDCTNKIYVLPIGLHHPLDGITNPEYKLLRFIQPTKFFCKKKNALAINWDRCCHLALCLGTILFHCRGLQCHL